MWFICANEHSDGASIGCFRKKYQTVLISRKQFAQACNNTLHCQNVCANTLFAQIASTCRGSCNLCHLHLRFNIAQSALFSITLPWPSFYLLVNFPFSFNIFPFLSSVIYLIIFWKSFLFIVCLSTDLFFAFFLPICHILFAICLGGLIQHNLSPPCVNSTLNVHLFLFYFIFLNKHTFLCWF